MELPTKKSIKSIGNNFTRGIIDGHYPSVISVSTKIKLNITDGYIIPMEFSSILLKKVSINEHQKASRKHLYQ